MDLRLPVDEAEDLWPWPDLRRLLLFELEVLRRSEVEEERPPPMRALNMMGWAESWLRSCDLDAHVVWCVQWSWTVLSS